MTLQEALQTVATRWKFSDRHYPNLPIGVERQKRFAINHIMYHLEKAIGNISAQLERADHGKLMREDDLRDAGKKLLVNTLRLNEILGIDEEELVVSIQYLDPPL